MRVGVVPHKPDLDLNPEPGKWGWVTGENIQVFIFSGISNCPDEIIKIPAGSKTNFASLPPPLRMFYKSYGKWTVPTVVHDYIYRERQSDFSKSFADKLFYVMMKYYGVTWFTRNLFYVGVTLNIYRLWNWNR